MPPVRIIARLDVKGPHLVKGVQLEGLRVLGAPEEFARHYYDGGADELLYLDIVASLYERNSLIDFIRRTSAEVFIPLTVGGGIRSLDDLHAVLAAGADKVAINTQAVRQPEFITQAADRFGSSAIVVSLEVKRRGPTAEVYTDCGRIRTGREAMAWAREAVERGGGELLVTSIDHEGMGGGFDLDLTRQISDQASVPVVASGGAGCVEHVRDVFERGAACGAAIASLFHYDAIERLSKAGSPARPRFSRIRPASIGDLKAHLTEHGVRCRYQLCDVSSDFKPAAGRNR